MGNCIPKSPCSKIRILVLGASGNVGRATLVQLLIRHGHEPIQITAGVRDPLKFATLWSFTWNSLQTDDASYPAAAHGRRITQEEAIDSYHDSDDDSLPSSTNSSRIHIVKANMGGNRPHLTALLRQYDCVFLVTPGHEDRVKITLNAIHAAKDAHVPYTLVVSMVTADTDTIFGRQMALIEHAIQTVGLKSHGILRLPLFMDNFYYHYSMSAIAASSHHHHHNATDHASDHGGGDEQNHLTLYDPRNPNKCFTPIVVNDVGKAAADILAHPILHHNQTYKLVMHPGFSLNQLAETFGSTTMVPHKHQHQPQPPQRVTITQVPYAVAKKAYLDMGFPEWQVNGILEIFHMIDEDNPVVNHHQVDENDFEYITRGETPMTMPQLVRANAAGFQPPTTSTIISQEVMPDDNGPQR